MIRHLLPLVKSKILAAVLLLYIVKESCISELLAFRTLSIARYSKKLENTTFQNCIYFRPQMRGKWLRLAVFKGPNRVGVSPLT
jgi:hypothetical protein